MSIYQDGTNTFSGTWHSSLWKPYYHEPTSRVLHSSTGDDEIPITIWCSEEEQVGVDVEIRVGNLSPDLVTLFHYERKGGSFDSTPFQNLPVNEFPQNDESVKYWFAPGLGFQMNAGIHATTSYTELTKYTYTVVNTDIGEKIYDGGIHCWMRLPNDHIGSGSPSNWLTVYSKPIPEEYLQGRDFKMVFNSFGHQPTAVEIGNKALTMQYEQSIDDGNWKHVSATPEFNDIDPANTTTDVSADFMKTILITSPGFAKRDGLGKYRFKWYSDDGSGVEAKFHCANFIHISLYPLQ